MHLQVKEIGARAPVVSPGVLAEHMNGPRRSWYVWPKVVLEWVTAVVLLVPSAVIVMLCAAAVKASDPGPALYRQQRVGRRGRVYWIYKIRSMRHDCERETGAVWSSGKDDPRVTRIGRFLRDTHLDELPQLLNVLMFQMSLIGPRPERPSIVAELEREIPFYRDRLLVRPGLTGLAQMQLPPDSDVASVKRKLAYDRYYVQQMSLWLDVRILLCTFLYMAAAMSHALGQLLVKSHAREVERRFRDVRVLEEPAAAAGSV